MRRRRGGAGERGRGDEQRRGMVASQRMTLQLRCRRICKPSCVLERREGGARTTDYVTATSAKEAQPSPTSCGGLPYCGLHSRTPLMAAGGRGGAQVQREKEGAYLPPEEYERIQQEISSKSDRLAEVQTVWRMERRSASRKRACSS